MSKKELIAIILALVVIFSIGLVLFFVKNSNKNNNISQKDDYGEIEILVQSGDIYQKVSIPKGEVKQASALERGDFSEFSGLPDKKESSFFQDAIVIKSENNDKVVLKSSLDGREFKCQISNKFCEKSDIFSKKYKSGEFDVDNNSVFWLNWNESIGFVYGVENNDINLGILRACSIESGKCEVLENLNFPTGVISPKVDKIVAIRQNDIANEKTGEKWEFFIYDLKNLKNPLKNFDISGMIGDEEDLVYDGINSVAWSRDESGVFLGTTRGIFRLDLGSGEIKEIFKDVAENEDDIYWNSDNLKVSEDGRYVVFIDTIENFEDENENSEEENGWDNVLKAIDLSDNKIIELIQVKDLRLE